MAIHVQAHRERHSVQRIGWLRAAVLGANDGIVSTASLIVGVAGAAQGRAEVLVAGMAGLVAGAMSMAAGEYVSVSSQADAEKADLARERRELAEFPDAEHTELVGIYRKRGLSAELVEQVALALERTGTLEAHARDELGLDELQRARPVQAAFASATTFSGGAVIPLAVAALVPLAGVPVAVSLASLLCLVALGAIGAAAGGAPVPAGVARVAFWGAAAMAVTYLIGRLFGTSLG